MKPSRRLLPLAVIAPCVLALLFPAAAEAHGIVGRADLPIPVWLFSWAAAIVLVVSFVALSTLWTRPQLQTEHRKALLRIPAAVEVLGSVFGVAVFALVVYSGFAGTQVWSANFSVTFIYVIFWVGMPLASVLLGDIFAVLSPWRSCARAIRAAGCRLAPKAFARPPLRYPEKLGQFPATALLIGFAWLELVYVERDSPEILAALSLGYFLLMLAGMLAFGDEIWATSADGFGAYFGLLSRMSPLTVDEDGELYARRPLSALTSMPVRPGTVALVCAVIGTTTFDGFSNDVVWRKLEPHLQSLYSGISFHPTPAIELAYTTGLLLCIVVIRLVYELGIRGVQTVSYRYTRAELSRAFAHTLVPIGFAYVLAHYFSLLIWQGQAIGYLASDPLGNGANILGTSSYRIDYTIISFAAIWYVQVTALVAGHVGGLTLAHDRALTMYRGAQEAVRSQYWMLTVMVAFTSFGLWLLSAVGT
ncbi:MAG TPA: fenitrothion hydrolase [Solirubrobacteraceae bacterium]|nr:fenitrothion hydrolase [Solirubrobacteraceae bacterium]